jgi:hypothetical protein
MLGSTPEGAANGAAAKRIFFAKNTSINAMNQIFIFTLSGITTGIDAKCQLVFS